MIDLERKVVMITGGAGGLGANMARLCASLGARIVIADIDGAGAEGDGFRDRSGGSRPRLRHLDRSSGQCDGRGGPDAPLGGSTRS